MKFPPISKVYVPTRVTPSGYRHLSVKRNDMVRIVSFENPYDAQKAIDAMEMGDLIHVLGGILTYKISAEGEEGPMIVHEMSPETVTRGSDLCMDVCSFYPPHYVELRMSIMSEGDPASRLERIRRSLQG